MKRLSVLFVTLIITSFILCLTSCKNMRNEDELWGYINKKGEIVIEPRFLWAGDFKNGIAPVRWREGYHVPLIKKIKNGFINKYGENVLELDSSIINSTHFFDDGVAGVQTCNNSLDDCKWGFIDRKGRYVIEPRYYNFRFFSEGLAAVNEIKNCDHTDIDREYRFINASGQVAIKGPFDDAGTFNEGYAPVQVCEENEYFDFGITGCKWGLIDKNGIFSVRPDIEYIFPHNYVSEGFLGVRFLTGKESNNRSDFIDVKGNIVIPPLYCDADNFHEGLARVSKCKDCNNHRGCSYGFVDKTGRIVIPVEYDTKEVFTEGLVPYTKLFKGYGFMNRWGEVVIKPEYTAAWNFSEGLAAVEETEKQETKSLFGRKKHRYCARIGFIDHSGDYIIEPQPFREVGMFHEGLAAVKVRHDGHCY